MSPAILGLSGIGSGGHGCGENAQTSKDKLNTQRIDKAKTAVRSKLSLAFPSKGAKSEFCLCSNTEVTTASKKKASCHLRLAQKTWSALSTIAIDRPFSGPSQTRPLSFVPGKSSLSPKPVERLQSQDEEPKCTLTLSNSPQIQIQNGKYPVRGPTERCLKGFTGFAFSPTAFQQQHQH